MAVLIENATLVKPGVGALTGSILLSDGRIAAINPSPPQIPDACEKHDANEKLLTPGLVDIHTHGIDECSYDWEAEHYLGAASRLARYGTTTVLPTLYKTLDRNSLGKLEQFSCAISSIDSMPGFHLEGPFLAIPGAGAATIPGDLALLGDLLSAAQGRVLAMSVSPDCPRIIPVIEHLREAGVAVFLTHTRASVKETLASIAAGARHATHFYDVFPLPKEADAGVRPVGAVETILADRSCTVDFICDGVHVDPMAIRMALAAKGWQGVVAITDSNVGAGMSPGVYSSPWGYSIRVGTEGGARVHDASHPLHGQLAGSVLTMDRAMTNLHRWLDVPTHHIWALGTCNPARIVGLMNKGVLDVGADADVVLWEHSDLGFQAIRTWQRGRCVFDRDGITEIERASHAKYISI